MFMDIFKLKLKSCLSVSSLDQKRFYMLYKNKHILSFADICKFSNICTNSVTSCNDVARAGHETKRSQIMSRFVVIIMHNNALWVVYYGFLV